MNERRIVIGTRGSDLALWQANETARLINAPTEISIIRTSGDRFQDIALQGQLEQGFFTKEIERRLLDGEIDIAVHSLKDLPTQIVDGLVIGAHLPRAAVSDLLVVNPEFHDAARPIPVQTGTQVGAMSLRRQSLLKQFGSQCRAVMIRGNVPSRIQRCREGEFGAVILARAGVERLGLDLSDLEVYELKPELWPPAPGQGVVAVEARTADATVLALLEEMNNPSAHQAAELERQVLANFEGGCHTAFGAWAHQIDGQWLLLIGLEQDGRWLQSEQAASWEELARLGPQSGMEFTEPVIEDQEDLCRPVRW